MELLKIDARKPPASAVAKNRGGGVASSGSDTDRADPADDEDDSSDPSSYGSYLRLLEQLYPGVARRVYVFQQVTIREVIYSRLPFSYRATFHRVIAEWYAVRFEANLVPVLGKLAFHWLHSARCESVTEAKTAAYKSALHFLLLSGQNAAAKYATREALEYFVQARAIIPHAYPHTSSSGGGGAHGATNAGHSIACKWKEVEVLEMMLPCYTVVHGVPASLAEYNHMLQLVEELHGIKSREERENRKALRHQARAERLRVQLGEAAPAPCNPLGFPAPTSPVTDSEDSDDYDDELATVDPRAACIHGCPSESVTEAECQSLVFVALLGVTAALANGGASLGKISNVGHKIRRLIALAHRLGNEVYITDALLQGIMHYNFSGGYVRAALAGLQLIERMDQAFVHERAKAKRKLKAERAAAAAARKGDAGAAIDSLASSHLSLTPSSATGAGAAGQPVPDASTLVPPTTLSSTPGIVLPPSSSSPSQAVTPALEGVLVRQVSEASFRAQVEVDSRLASSMGGGAAVEVASTGTALPAAQAATEAAVAAHHSTYVPTTTPPLHGAVSVFALRPRNLYSPTMGGRLMTAWALVNLGYLRLALDLVAQLALISARLPGTHAALQAAGARRVVLSFLGDPYLTAAEALKYLTQARLNAETFQVYMWQLALNHLRATEAVDQGSRRQIAEDTWKHVDEGMRISTMFSWMVCSILSFSTHRSGYALGLKYTRAWWAHSFQAREETNSLAEMFRYRAGFFRAVWRARHTAWRNQEPGHLHRCTGRAEQMRAGEAGALPFVSSSSEYLVDLPRRFDAASPPPHVDAEDMPCSVLLTHLFACLYRSCLLARTQHALLPETRCYTLLLDVLDELEYGICVEIRGNEAEQDKTWERNRAKRCACPVGQTFVRCIKVLGAELTRMQQRHQREQRAAATPAAPAPVPSPLSATGAGSTLPSSRPGARSSSSMYYTTSAGAVASAGPAGVLLQCPDKWGSATEPPKPLHLHRDIIMDEYPLYVLLARPPEAIRPRSRSAATNALTKLHSHAGPQQQSSAAMKSPSDTLDVPSAIRSEAGSLHPRPAAAERATSSLTFSSAAMLLATSTKSPRAPASSSKLPARSQGNEAPSGAFAIAEDKEEEDERSIVDAGRDTHEQEPVDVDHLSLLRSSPLLIFVADARMRATISLRTLLARVIRPAHVAHTTAEITALHAFDTAATQQRAAERARKNRAEAEKQRVDAADRAAQQAAASSATSEPSIPSALFELPSPPALEVHPRSPVEAAPSSSPLPAPVAAAAAAPAAASPERSANGGAAAAAASGVLGADTAGVGALLQSPLLSGSLPRLASGDRLAQLELLQVAQMRVEEGRARAVFEQRHKRNPNREWQPTVTRHFRRFPV